MTTRRVVEWDVDEADYIGDGQDGVYYLAGQNAAGEWFVTVVVDSDTGGFCENIYTDHGPFDSEEAANDFGHGTALDWCLTNGVDYDDETE